MMNNNSNNNKSKNSSDNNAGLEKQADPVRPAPVGASPHADGISAVPAQRKQQLHQSRFPFGLHDDGGFSDLIKDISRSSSAPPIQPFMNGGGLGAGKNSQSPLLPSRSRLGMNATTASLLLQDDTLDTASDGGLFGIMNNVGGGIQQQQQQHRDQFADINDQEPEVVQEIESFMSASERGSSSYQQLPTPGYHSGQAWQIWGSPSSASAAIGGGSGTNGANSAWTNSDSRPNHNHNHHHHQSPNLMAKQKSVGSPRQQPAGRMQVHNAPESAPIYSLHQQQQQQSQQHLSSQGESQYRSAVGSSINRTPSPGMMYSQQQQSQKAVRLPSGHVDVGADLQRLRLASKTPPPPGLSIQQFQSLVALPRSSSTPPTAAMNAFNGNNSTANRGVQRSGSSLSVHSHHHPTNQSPMISHSHLSQSIVIDDIEESDDTHLDKDMIASIRNFGLSDEDDFGQPPQSSLTEQNGGSGYNKSSPSARVAAFNSPSHSYQHEKPYNHSMQFGGLNSGYSEFEHSPSGALNYPAHVNCNAYTSANPSMLMQYPHDSFDYHQSRPQSAQHAYYSDSMSHGHHGYQQQQHHHNHYHNNGNHSAHNGFQHHGGNNERFTRSHTRQSAPVQQNRSQALDEFRANMKTKKYELGDILGHVVEFSSDQHGSRFIQQKLEYAEPKVRAALFEELCPHSFDLTTDVFGNYVVQKFFEYGSPEQRSRLIHNMAGKFMQLSVQTYGCRVVQKSLEFGKPEEQCKIIHELEPSITALVKDQNGNHVVQKAIEIASPGDIKVIIGSFGGQVFSLATHAYGCRVMQRIFEHCDEALTRPLVKELSTFTQTLVQDQYGNYVIQHILERGNPEDRANILRQVRGQLLHLSRHKFASNVIEKCVIYASETQRTELIDELLAIPAGKVGSAAQQSPSSQQNVENMPLMQMMRDQFANYVVQRLLEVCSKPQLEKILAVVRPNVVMIKKFTYGRHVVTKLEKIVGSQAWMQQE
ncbi:hypothetical protein MP228_010726 [Amoeboaphelidium protococcarum]|nr:hypothetical protein MP228_010726 [Amoeboaphelidium protococcarum]